MDERLINAEFGVPVNTLIKWKKTRPNYYAFLQRATQYLSLLNQSQQDALFALVDDKDINEYLGVNKHYPTDVMGISARTIASWSTTGKSKQYIGLVYGALLGDIERELTALNKSLSDLSTNEVSLLDVFFIITHRPSLTQVILTSMVH